MTLKNNDELLRKTLGISISDINEKTLAEIVTDTFLYHEGMADIALGAINKKDASGQVPDSSILWDSFQTNNTIAYSLRGILLKSSDNSEIG